MLRACRVALLLLTATVPVLAAQQALPNPCASDTTTATLRRCMSTELHAADSTLAVYYDTALRRAAAPSEAQTPSGLRWPLGSSPAPSC